MSSAAGTACTLDALERDERPRHPWHHPWKRSAARRRPFRFRSHLQVVAGPAGNEDRDEGRHGQTEQAPGS